MYGTALDEGTRFGEEPSESTGSGDLHSPFKSQALRHRYLPYLRGRHPRRIRQVGGSRTVDGRHT